MSAEEKESARSAEAKDDGGAAAAGNDVEDGPDGDDGMTFVLPEAKSLSPTARPAGMGGLDLSLAMGMGAAVQREDGAKASGEEGLAMKRATAPVIILFDLPDGSQVEEEFQMGQTIEVLKSFVMEECGIPMAKQTLYLENGTGPLMDPMSIMDYPEIDPRQEVLIRVDGSLEDMEVGAKK